MEIREDFNNYALPFDVAADTRIILSYARPEHLAGLKHIVLTNIAGLPRPERRRSSLSAGTAGGRYHQRSAAGPAWIEIFVDSVLLDGRNFLLRIPFFRQLLLAEVIYHEVGHHIHIGLSRGTYDKEVIADKLGRRLRASFIRRKFWYLTPLLYLVIFARRSAKAAARLYMKMKKSLA